MPKKKQESGVEKQYLTIKIARSKHTIKTTHFNIEDISLGSNDKRQRYQIFKVKFEACTYGSKQHVLIHKLAERGFDYAFIVNNMEDIKNPMEEEIPIIYLKNGKPKYHYDTNASTTKGVSRAVHTIEFICAKISTYFVIEGQIDFDGDNRAKKDKNLQIPQLEIQQIGFENA